MGNYAKRAWAHEQDLSADFSYAFWARAQETPGYMGPLYGYPVDEVNPEVGYPFWDWSDLPPYVRFLMAVPDEFTDSMQYGYRSWDTLGAVVADAPDLKTARVIVEEAHYNEVMRRKEALAALDIDNPYFRNVQPGMERYLKADPGEISAIMERVKEGVVGREVTCDEPIPVFTCVWIAGGVIRGVTPGSMSNAVTCAQPEIKAVDKDGRKIYRQRVFVK